MNLSKSQKGSIYAALSGLLYGLVGYFGISIIQADFSISNMLFWRFAFASIIVAGFLFFQGKKIQFSWQLMVASVFYAGGSGIYFIASKYIGSGLAMVIFFVYPIIIILFNCLFYKHKIGRIYYISVFLLLLGLGCLIRKDEVSFDLYGISFALLSALIYAVYIIYSQKKISLPPLESTFAISMGSSILCFIIALCEGSLIIPASTTLWFNIIGMALICTVIPILFLLEGLKLISAEKAALLSVLEPVFVLIIGAWLLNEQVTMIQYFGVFAILSSAIIATKSN